MTKNELKKDNSLMSVSELLESLGIVSKRGKEVILRLVSEKVLSADETKDGKLFFKKDNPTVSKLREEIEQVRKITENNLSSVEVYKRLDISKEKMNYDIKVGNKKPSHDLITEFPHLTYETSLGLRMVLSKPKGTTQSRQRRLERYYFPNDPKKYPENIKARKTSNVLAETKKNENEYMEAGELLEFLGLNQNSNANNRIVYWLRRGIIRPVNNSKTRFFYDKKDKKIIELRRQIKKAKKIVKENYDLKQTAKEIGIADVTLRKWINLGKVKPTFDLVKEFPNLATDANKKNAKIINLTDDDKKHFLGKFYFSKKDIEKAKKIEITVN